MPLTNKGQKIKDSMRERYGKKKGESVFYASKNKGTIKGVEEAKKDDWIQDAEKDIEKRGTEGVCTGDKFGGPTCPPGSKRYNLAKTFRKMAKKRQDEEVRGTASPAMQALMKRTAELKAKKERAALMKANKERKDEAQSFSKTDTDAMRDAAKPLNPKPKKAKTPSLTAGGNTTAGANAAGDEGVPVGNDANKKAQELKQQNIKTRSMYEAAPLLAAGLRALAGPLVRRAGIAVGKGAAKGGAKRGAAKMARTAAKDPKKMAALGNAAAAGVETLTSKLKGNRKMEDNTQYKNSYVTTLLETRASKKTQAAKDRFEAGQKIFGKTKDFNPGAKQFRPTAASEKEKLARQGMVPPKVGGRTRKGMRDHTGYRRIGSMLAEAMGLVEMQYRGKSLIRKKGKDLENKPKLDIPAGSKLAPRKPLTKKNPGETTAQAIERSYSKK
tara:strand:- start:2213 stop:3538 length:1326 start_codon:yes stop_codon:yes gene_type:complete